MSVFPAPSRQEMRFSGFDGSRYSKVNDWNEATQALKMPTLLEGKALAIWMELEEDDQKDYKRAKEKIIGKMMPMAFTTLDDFHRRQLRPGEPLPLLYMASRLC